MSCKCKIFFGAVEEMKGNEARVVFFLHAVDKFKHGRVEKEKQKEEWTMKNETLKRKRNKEEGRVSKKRKFERDSEEEKVMLLHTEPFYLAITRSSCEVNFEQLS